jgi:hypothetical protein
LLTIYDKISKDIHHLEKETLKGHRNLPFESSPLFCSLLAEEAAADSTELLSSLLSSSFDGRESMMGRRFPVSSFTCKYQKEM